MAFEHYISHGTKRLRCGYTTGSCATLAAKACCEMLFTQDRLEIVCIKTPKGIPVCVSVIDVHIGKNQTCCAVKKDAGDDCDVTDGALIYATVEKIDGKDIIIDGGKGVGRITKKGLDQAIGMAAINSIPRKMIYEEVVNVCKKYSYDGGIKITISVPMGEQLASKTFNPNLGIEGGISILGTSGIVEPQSLQALLASIELEVKMLSAEGKKDLIITLGNYGESFINSHDCFNDISRVKCSNFIGDTLDFGASYGFDNIILVGHIGKLVKLAGGIMNTHSRFADCRTELFAVHSALCGAKQEIIEKLYYSATTDACIEILIENEILENVMKSITNAVERHLIHRAGDAFHVGAVLFSNQYGVLGITNGANDIMKKWGKESL